MLRVPSQSLNALRHAVTHAVLPFVFSVSAFAQTTSPPAPVPPTPPPLVTNTGNLSTVGAGGCLQQYTIPVQNLQQDALDDQLASVVAEGIGVAAVGVNLVAQEAAAFADAATFGVMAGGLVAAAAGDPALAAAPGLTTAAGAATVLATSSGVKSAALLAAITGFASDEVALAANIATQLHAQDALNLTVYQQTRPNCDQQFTGTVTVQGGGVNVTGPSIFHDDVGIDGNLAISGDFSANQVNTSQGISAHGGAIFLGNPDGITFFEGITIGGGAVSGAGFGGTLAFTGDVTAIAIGNGASAASVNSLALGTGANAAATGATAIGNTASATAAGATALGQNSLASGSGSIAIGNATSTGTNTIAIGTGAVATASVAIGAGAMASGGGTAIGDFAMANTGVRGSAFGNGAQAGGNESVAIGTNSSAAFANSAAFGTNATATRSNQQVFGTARNTYTMPGITSSDSRSNQSGLLEVATTDAAGNLATDGGDIFNALARVQAGVAIAMAIETPELATGENFGIRFGWGGFDSFESNANAMGASAIGVLGRNLFRDGDRLAVDAGVGLGWSEFKDYNQSRVLAGRVGLQFTW